MENENKKVSLPMGTVFKLKEADKTAIIVQRYGKTNSGKDCDYLICEYPEGKGNDSLYACNNEDIEEILALGYYDVNDSNYLSGIKKIIEDNNIKTDSLENPETYPNTSIILPVGSLVRYKPDGEMAMVIGHCAFGDDGNIYDYIFCSLPDGDAMGVANHDELEDLDFEIFSEGYINYECNRYMRSVKKVLDKIKKKYNKTDSEKGIFNRK